jgi:hypothetical protein
MLSVSSSKASKIAYSFSTVRTVRGAPPVSFLFGKMWPVSMVHQNHFMIGMIPVRKAALAFRPHSP